MSYFYLFIFLTTFKRVKSCGVPRYYFNEMYTGGIQSHILLYNNVCYKVRWMLFITCVL